MTTTKEAKEENSRKVLVIRLASELDSAVTEILAAQTDLDRATRRAAAASSKHATLLAEMIRLASEPIDAAEGCS